MAIKIRLTRKGDKKSPFYRIIVADSKSPRDGKFIDILGTYNPLTQPSEIKIDNEKVKYWLDNGAKPTDTAQDLLVKAGVLTRTEKKTKTAK
ncbi:MAG: 30S ribosomal protein S16 [Clostridia bacterium]|jgi:small subunit ribosomal protein S16|nr:30S ribosomal protein S16 [Clostridia bacterium]MDD3232312.1 30S ribosomal protein S16 [Clostridia bacterium]MDD3862835.1 30S ribosomal protein S16 [Clostridia bacterium]MDD4408633.1 30S ribosomal protein S16 [Clostridia bacterium]